MEKDTESAELTESVEFDPEELRRLLSVLTEFKVQAFQGWGLSFAFFEEAPFAGFTAKPSKTQEEDDGHSTSNKRVSGFGTMRDPRLWPSQNGKTITFDGGYSE